MLGYVIRRLAWLIAVLLALSLITFALMHALPGGPWDSDKPLSHLDPELVEALNEKYGLESRYGSNTVLSSGMQFKATWDCLINMETAE